MFNAYPIHINVYHRLKPLPGNNTRKSKNKVIRYLNLNLLKPSHLYPLFQFPAAAQLRKQTYPFSSCPQVSFSLNKLHTPIVAALSSRISNKNKLNCPKQLLREASPFEASTF